MLDKPFQNSAFRFIKVRKNDKRALEDGWQNDAAYKFDAPELLEWIAKGGNVGIRGGDANALILDIDSSERILDKGLVLQDTTSWETRPGRQQRLYICNDWIPKILEKYAGKDKDQIKFYDSEEKDDKGHYVHIGEVQGARHYGVIPPSIKTVDGKKYAYKMLNDMPPASISLGWLLETLVESGFRFSDRDKTKLDLNAEKLEAAITKGKRKVLYDGREVLKRKYARKAFEEEIEILKDSSEGTRNDQLNTSALKIGSLVGSGYITRFEADRELTRAARFIGLDESEIARTIESGLGDGIKTPRVIPEPEEARSVPIPKSQMQMAPELVESESPQKEAIASILVKLAINNSLEIWHTPNGNGYITVSMNSHKEHYKLSSKSTRTWLGKIGHELMGKTPGLSAIKDAVNVLEGMAVYEGKEYEFHVRKAELNGKIYIDLGDPAWHVVEVTKDGWEVRSDCGIRFRRAGNSLPLPIPTKGGSLEDLRPLINASSNDNWILIKAWITQAFWCRGPYAHMYFRGTQGTAKSYMMACLKAISDPSAAIKRRVPKGERDTAIALGSESIPCFDNMSGISDQIADLFCVASTGGVSTQRALFTDDEEAIIRIHCPIIYNGIDDLGQRGDLLDRTIVVDLEPIPEDQRKLEKDIEAAIEERRPALLGALLDITSKGLRDIGKEKLADLPRMADFAEWAYACLGAEGRTFLEVYTGSRDNTKYDLVEGNRFPKAIYRFVLEIKENVWKGTASDLLIELNKQEHILAGYEPDNWPKTPEKVGSELRRFTPALEALSVEVTYSRSGKEGRKIQIRAVPVTEEQTPTDTKKTNVGCQVSASDSIFSIIEDIDKESIEREEKKRGVVDIIAKGQKADTADTKAVDSDLTCDSAKTPDTTPDTDNSNRIRIAARQEFGINGYADARIIAGKLKITNEEVIKWLDFNYKKIEEFKYIQAKE